MIHRLPEADGWWGGRPKRPDPSREWVHHSDGPVLLPAVEIFGVDNVRSQGLRGSENRSVPIGDRKALREHHGYLHQFPVDGLTGTRRPLLNPFQGLSGGERTRRFLNHGYKEFLQDLSRRAKVLRLGQAKGPFPFALVLARTDCRVYQNVGIEEDLSVHADLRGSSSSCQAALWIACSVAAAAIERGARGPDARQGPSSTHAPA